MILEAPALKDGSGKELRNLHDTVQQHVRALKSMGYEPSGPFITSTLELKLDQTTMFEWQSHSQKSTGVPHYWDLLDFLNLRAQATESHASDRSHKRARPEAPGGRKPPGAITTYAGSIDGRSTHCVLCTDQRHPLYACPQFKSMSHETKLSTLMSNHLCKNCLGSGHFWKQCTSLHKCKTCQRPHHTLLHLDRQSISSTPVTVTPQNAPPSSALPLPQDNVPPNGIFTDTAVNLKGNSTHNPLLMTCRVRVKAPDGSSITARALLDSASSASFVTERIAQCLGLPRVKRDVTISGVAGLTHRAQAHSYSTFNILPAVGSSNKVISVTAVVVPRVTCDLPLHPTIFNPQWDHLSGLHLADPAFGRPSKIDMLLGVDVFVGALLNGRRTGPPGTLTTLETHFGWVLAGSADNQEVTSHVATHHIMLSLGDDILRRFWEIEEAPLSATNLSPEERAVV